MFTKLAFSSLAHASDFSNIPQLVLFINYAIHCMWWSIARAGLQHEDSISISPPVGRLITHQINFREAKIASPSLMQLLALVP